MPPKPSLNLPFTALFNYIIGDYIMSFILTVVLFSGSVIQQKFDTASACESAMYEKVDQVLLKNVKSADCFKR